MPNPNFIGREPQELARRFNDDEAVWRGFERKLAARLLPGQRLSLPHEVLDAFYWRPAERKCREVRVIGFSYPTP